MTFESDAVSAEPHQWLNSIDAFSVAVVGCDDAFQISHVNMAACRAFGATYQDLVGKHLSLVADFPIEDVMLEEIVNASPAAPRCLKRMDGSTFWALLRGAKVGAVSAFQFFDVDDLMKDHEAIVYRESMWRHAIEAAEHGVWEYDIAANTGFSSAAWKRLRGFPDDAVGVDSLRAWAARVHSDDLARIRKELKEQKLSRQSSLFSLKFRERRVDGSWIWISTQGKVVEWDENGLPARVTGTDTDVTKLVHSSQAIEALQRRHELALSTSGVGVWEIDLETQTFSCDEVLAGMYGFPKDLWNDIPLELWMQSLHPDDAEETVRKAQHAMTLGEGLESGFRIVRDNGEVRHITTSSVFYVAPNGKPRLLGADRDVTKAKQREADLGAQNMRFEAAIENMGHGLSMFDADGNLIVANKRYAELYGFPENLMKTGTATKVIVDYLQSTETLGAEILETATKDALLVAQHRPGFERTWQLANGRVISYSTNPLEAGGWISVHRDVTEQRLAERQLAESEDRFRDFTTTATDWCWETNAKNCVSHLTESFAANNGVDLTRIVGQHVQNLPMHSDDLLLLRELLERPDGSQHQPFKDVLLRMPMSKERLAYFLVSGLPKFDASGTFLGYRGTGTDVTAAEKRKMLLAEAQALLTTRTEQLNEAQKIGKIGDWSYNLCEGHIWWAPETFELLGRDPNTFETTYDAVMATYAGNGAERVLTSQADVLRTGKIKSVDVKARKVDGTIADFVVTSKARYDEQGDLVGFFGTIQDITERKDAEEQLERLAYFDPLTGLANRALFQREVDDILDQSKKTNFHGALLLLDLDRFKEVNDSLGHAAGDELLRKVGRLLSAAIERKHFLARLGGDEFAIIVPQAEKQELQALAQQLNQTLSGSLTLERGEINVSTSIGIALIPDDGGNPTDLLRNADLALYQAKEQGRNRFEFFSPDLNETVQNKMALSRDLRKAMTSGVDLALHYQPQIDLKSGRVTGYEALIRWNHPERGPISPAEFIPIAESSHLICDIGLWVLRSAATQAVAWLDAGEPPREVAVNVSAAQIWHSDLVSDVETVLNETGLWPSLLCLELTESLLVDHAEGRVRKVLKDLRELGVTLALDDFGTGYSSLGYLTQLPFNKLKVDRVFIDGAHDSVRSTELLKGIVALGRGLNMVVVAEGAERQTELDLLTELGCDIVQGYVCAKPTPADQALSYARDREKIARDGAKNVKFSNAS